MGADQFRNLDATIHRSRGPFVNTETSDRSGASGCERNHTMMAAGILNHPVERFDRLEKEPTRFVRIDLRPQQHRYLSRKTAGRCGLQDRGTTRFLIPRALIQYKRVSWTIRLKNSCFGAGIDSRCDQTYQVRGCPLNQQENHRAASIFHDLFSSA